MTPTIGRIVHYRLSEDDAQAINRRHAHARANIDKMRADKPGFQAHIGNDVYAGEIVPMIIVKIWGDPESGVNGQAILDGNDGLWVTSAKEGDEPGQWSWPPRI